jgi:hypothetical protein
MRNIRCPTVAEVRYHREGEKLAKSIQPGFFTCTTMPTDKCLPPALDDNSRALFPLALVLALYSFLPGTQGAAKWTVLSCWSHGYSV